MHERQSCVVEVVEGHCSQLATFKNNGPVMECHIKNLNAVLRCLVEHNTTY